MKKSFVVLVVLFTAVTGQSQESVIVSQPSLFVDFADAHQINDSIVKYYLTSASTQNASNDHLIVITFNINSSQIKLDTLRSSETDHFLLHSAYELWLSLMPDGSCLMVSNNFDCDISYTELVYFSIDGIVNWYINSFESGIDIGEVKSVGLIESDIIAIENSYEQWVFFNLNGEQKFFEFPFSVYYNTFNVKGQWFGTDKDEVVKLNDSFEVISYYSTDSIVFLELIGGDKLLVGTNSNLTLLDTLLNEISISEEIHQSISGKASLNSFWVATQEALYELDSNLVILNTHPAQPYETIHFVSAWGENVYVTSTYDGVLHKDFVIRKYIEDSLLHAPTIDLLLTSLKLPDKIIRIPQENPFVYKLWFDSLSFTIYNNSEDTIQSFNINFDWDNEYWCTYAVGEWIIDSVQVLPNDSIVIQLASFLTDLIFHVRSPFCFWVDYLNGSTDFDPLNDVACGNAEIISSVKSQEKHEVISIYPNPAMDRINISSEEGSLLNEVSIYSPSGVQLFKKSDCHVPCEVPIHELSAGIYWIKVVGDMNTQIRSFIKL